MPPYENRPGWGKTGEHQMTTDCKHAHIQTWRFEDSAEVAGLWSCTDCGRRFEPVAPVVDRVPLTDEQIEAVWKAHVLPGFGDRQKFYSPIVYAREIEAAHGITAAMKDKP